MTARLRFLLLCLSGALACSAPGSAAQAATSNRLSVQLRGGKAAVASAPAAAASLPASAASAPLSPTELAQQRVLDSATQLENFRKLGVGNEQVAFLAQPLGGKGAATPLLAHREHQPMQLASTAKLVTTYAALSQLSGGFRWHTQAFLSGNLAPSGTLDGNLIIAGGGDATLEASELQAWFAALQQRGLRHIRGNLVLDHSVFRQDGVDDGSPLPTPDNPHHARPDALILIDDTISVQLAAGAQPQLRFTPALANYQFVNRMGNGACAPQVSLNTSGDRLQVVLDGSWNAQCEARTLQIAVVPTSELTASLVAGAWQAAGGTLSGQVIQLYNSTIDYGTQKPWAVRDSGPLAQLVRDTNKSSDNLMARHLLLSLSPGFPARPASLPAAQARLRGWLAKLGLRGGISIQNGSGLSRGERASPRAMVTLLRSAWGSRVRGNLIGSLPVAGVDGTLGRRFQGSDAKRSAFLKTGTLSDVRALAGFVKGRSGTPYAVTVLVNSGNAGRAVPAMDELIAWVVRNG